MLFSDANYNNLNRQAKDKVVVLPLGAVEQHGHHLPVSTDTDIVRQVALQAEKQLSDDILLCPVLPFGSSHHHLSFGGTLSVSISTYTQELLIARGILKNSVVRKATYKPDAHTMSYIKELNDRIVQLENE